MLYALQHRLVGAFFLLQENSRRFLPLVAHTIISCKYYYILILYRGNVECSIQDGGLNMWQKNAHHHTLIQVPNVDVTPDLSTSLLDTTFKCLNSKFYFKTIQLSPSCNYMTVICYHLICVRWKGVPAQFSVLLPFQWECMTFDCLPCWCGEGSWGSWELQEVRGKMFEFWLMTEQVEDRRPRSHAVPSVI